MASTLYSGAKANLEVFKMIFLLYKRYKQHILHVVLAFISQKNSFKKV